MSTKQVLIEAVELDRLRNDSQRLACADADMDRMRAEFAACRQDRDACMESMHILQAERDRLALAEVEYATESVRLRGQRRELARLLNTLSDAVLGLLDDEDGVCLGDLPDRIANYLGPAQDAAQKWCLDHAPHEWAYDNAATEPEAP